MTVSRKRAGGTAGENDQRLAGQGKVEAEGYERCLAGLGKKQVTRAAEKKLD